MASCGSTLGVYTKLVQPINKTAFFGSSSFGSDHVKHLCNSTKPRLSYSLSTMIPKASATAIEEIIRKPNCVPYPNVINDPYFRPRSATVGRDYRQEIALRLFLDTVMHLYSLSTGICGKMGGWAGSTGRKVEDPELLEAIRLTIISNLLEYHPESSGQLAMGEAFGVEAPKTKLDVDITTRIRIDDDGPDRSLLSVETADRPG
ncbi:ACT domain-containing protein ACR11-like protein [Tanacetum coccineum]